MQARCKNPFKKPGNTFRGQKVVLCFFFVFQILEDQVMVEEQKPLEASPKNGAGMGTAGVT